MLQFIIKIFILQSHIQEQKFKIKIHNPIILPAALHGYVDAVWSELVTATLMKL
jgi:hypothetical protein